MSDVSESNDFPIIQFNNENHPDLPIVFKGLPYPNEALDQFYSKLIDFFAEFKNYINITKLEEIVITNDFRRALDDVDLGYESSFVKNYTDQDGMIAGGKCINIIREGEVKCIIILNIEPIIGLMSDDDESRHISAGIIAHELAHVENVMLLERSFPRITTKEKFGDFNKNVKLCNSLIFWDEYYACRTSGSIDYNTSVPDLINFVNTQYSYAKQRAQEGLIHFQQHGNAYQAVSDVGTAMLMPMKFASYLLGYVDCGHETEDVLDLLSEDTHPLYQKAITDLQAELRKIWDSIDSWQSMDMFGGIEQIVDRLLRAGGVTLGYKDNEPYAYVNILTSFDDPIES